jgi:uncharacterized protein involved in response to NO
MSYVEMNVMVKESSRPRTVWEHPVLALGFRPFFLLGALFAALSLGLWLPAFTGRLDFTGYSGAMGWHAHEMIFGFTTAIIAGFLLTAVGNWTGVKMPHGRWLAGLVLLWLAGRLAMVVAVMPGVAIPSGLVLAIDMAFLPALAFAVGRPIVGTSNRRNLGFIPLLGLLAMANLGFHLEASGLFRGFGATATNLAIHVIVVIMVVIGGRVVPMFTRNALGDASIEKWPAVDRIAIGACVGLVIVDVWMTNSVWSGWMALLAAGATLLRMARWGSFKTVRVPLLWVLHVGFVFIPVGLLLKSLALNFDLVALGASTHALTVGAIGILTLGMMARVALGHTGRPLVASPIVAVSFGLMTLAAVLRVLTPIIGMSWYLQGVLVSGVLMSGAFLIYLFVYWSILTTPRPDGRPG